MKKVLLNGTVGFRYWHLLDANADKKERWTGAQPALSYFPESMKTKTFAFAALLGFLALCGCKTDGTDGSKPKQTGSVANAGSTRSESDTVRVVAATYPVAWLGCELVGEPCKPEALVPPGASAHSWEPRPSDLQKLDRATVFVQAGLAFEEAWVPRFRSSVSGLVVIDARGGLDLKENEPGHHHGPEESDPHVWSSPRAMDRLADTLSARLLEYCPEFRVRLSKNLPATHSVLLALDTAVRQLLAPYSGRTFLVNHPGLGYLARDYGLVQKPLESHGQDLTPVMLWDVRRTAKAQGIKAVFVQNEYSRRTADQVAAELGIPAVDLDLLSEAPYDSLFMVCARKMADKL